MTSSLRQQVARTGAPWRDLPERYGPWQTGADRLYRWRRDGTWDRILALALPRLDCLIAVRGDRR